MMLRLGLIEARSNNGWFEEYRRWGNIPDRLHFKQLWGLSVTTNDTDGNNPYASWRYLEGKLQTHQLHFFVLHHGTGNEFLRRRLKTPSLSELKVNKTTIFPSRLLEVN